MLAREFIQHTQWRVSHFQSFVAKRMQQICTNYNEDTNRLPFHNDGLTLFWLTMTKSSLNASVKTSPPFIRNKIIVLYSLVPHPSQLSKYFDGTKSLFDFLIGDS